MIRDGNQKELEERREESVRKTLARNRRNRYEERHASKVGEQQNDINNMNNKVREDKEKLFLITERKRKRAVSYTHLDVYKRQYNLCFVKFPE